ncbi:hypothetical protein DV738_g2730, partial [Chaetothyriales sp. CBS 135597]
MAYNRVSSFGSTDSGYESGAAADMFDQQARLKRQEHEKEVARHRQQLLAQELSRMDADDYAQDMLEHMLRMDAETLPDVDAIDIQTEIQWCMRPYLLDFLIEAHSAFQLLPETLFLAINLLDRYCSKRVVYKRHYQLVGCAALLIASKYGDKKEKVPTIKELKSMCCSLYDDDMFLQMEWHVLSTLGWVIGHPTADAFLKMATKASLVDPEVENLTLCILEIALYHREFVSQKSSILALAALALARHILGRPPARHTEWASQFSSSVFMDLSDRMSSPSLIVSRKYASARHFGVSKFLSSWFERRAMLANRAPLTPTQEQTPPSATAHHGNSFQAVGTPQKGHFGAVSLHGLYTPPITPDVAAPKTGFNFAAGTPTTNTQFQFTGQTHISSAAPSWTFETY